MHLIPVFISDSVKLLSVSQVSDLSLWLHPALCTGWCSPGFGALSSAASWAGTEQSRVLSVECFCDSVLTS